jgi:hypothetical protein
MPSASEPSAGLRLASDAPAVNRSVSRFAQPATFMRLPHVEDPAASTWRSSACRSTAAHPGRARLGYGDPIAIVIIRPYSYFQRSR